jgi:16S rRNA G966 N2-methylase RsmD
MADVFNRQDEFDLFGVPVEEDKDASLCERFIIPPFSVFDTKQGYWQDRKKLWTSLGIKSELGRDATTFNMKDWADKKRAEGKISGNTMPSDTSIFDPVLCEICYKWFCPDGGKILDPFAGGSVRGIVAEKLGFHYTGIDLSTAQIEANRENAKELNVSPTWYNDDSMNVGKYVEDESVDLIFSCPPYYDLEVYSDKEEDLSNMDWASFKKAYIEIIKRCCSKLKPNRFAIFVVGDIRDKEGYYRNFVDLTKYAFYQGDCQTWNEVILLNQLTSAGMRSATPFNANRKLTKVHQNVLIFYKGDPTKIRENFKELDLDY